MRSLAQLFRLSVFAFLALSALQAHAATGSVQSDNWDDWVYERHQMLANVAVKERSALRQSLYVVKEHWMEAQGYAIYARTPERLDAYVQWLQGRELDELIALAKALEAGDSDALAKLTPATPPQR